MSDATLVSIIICTRDRAADLAGTLEALGRTSVPADMPCELLIVDNGSTDGTARLAQECRLPNMPVRYLREERPGKGHAYNAGIAAAQGRVLLFTDDDVRPPSDWVAGMAGPILRGEADAVAGGVKLPPHLERPWMDHIYRGLLAASDGLHPERPWAMIGANMAFGRHVLDRVPAFDPELGPGALGFFEESLFSWQLKRAGFRLTAALPVAVEHHMDPARITREHFLSTARKYGRSLAYVDHHWEHRPQKAVRARLWLRRLRLGALRLRHAVGRPRHAEYAPHWEAQQVQAIGFFRQFLLERKRPRSYDRHGLVKKRPGAETDGARPLWVVAYLYNTNGMASWCWEAAHALAEAGEPVLLVCSRDVPLPDGGSVEILRFDPPAPPRDTTWRKIRPEIERLSPRSSGFIGHLHRHLQAQGVTPTAYLLNQTDAQDPTVDVPQYVTGWAYPTSFAGYAAKVGRYAGWRPSRAWARTALATLGWWGKDWRAYRGATGVLAVSHRIAGDLAARRVNVRVVPPGTAMAGGGPEARAGGPCRLLIAAADLEEPRKRVRWMIEALKDGPARDFHLTLVGQAGDAFRAWVCAGDFPATFTGRLTRDRVQDVMAEHDLFLFASSLDDWGYVLVEAMSRGLVVVAPDLSPFDEIVGDTGALYDLDSQSQFREKVSGLIGGDVPAARRAAWDRAGRLFSRPAFARDLLAVIRPDGRRSTSC